MPRAMCVTCSTKDRIVEFPTVRELNEHIKGGHKTQPPEVAKTSREEVAEALEKRREAPIELAYRYQGNCPDCGTVINTISVPIGEDTEYLVAFCSRCNKQHQGRKVIPLAKQFTKSKTDRKKD